MTTTEILSPEIKHILLSGWAAARFSTMTEADRSEALKLWHGGAHIWASAWREHQDALRAFASEHGIKPTNGAFFAEFIARNVSR